MSERQVDYIVQSERDRRMTRIIAKIMANWFMERVEFFRRQGMTARAAIETAYLELDEIKSMN